MSTCICKVYLDWRAYDTLLHNWSELKHQALSLVLRSYLAKLLDRLLGVYGPSPKYLRS